MRCNQCKVSVMLKPLRRVNPTGEDGIWWCDDCLEEHEPELFNNLKEDETQVEKDLKSIIY